MKDSFGHVCQYPEISPALAAELLQITPSHDRFVDYRPCQVTLKEGRVIDQVYVSEMGSYVRVWGVWPEHDTGKRSISIADVARIEESPSRLPVEVANQLYAAGESGMGYCHFLLVMKDGLQIPCVTGNAVDFLDLPPDISPREIVGVLPHRGRERITSGQPHVRGADYVWCLYAVPQVVLG